MNPFSLNNDDFSTNFMATHQTETQLRISFGDYARFSDDAATHMVKARNAFVTGSETIAKLKRDESRTEVQKHGMAKEVAARTIGAIDAQANALTALAGLLDRRAKGMVDERFAVDPDRAAIQSELRGWIRETAKTENGIAVIRAATAEDAEVAAVLYHSPKFLLGLADEVRVNLVADGIEKHVPKAGTMMAESHALTNLAVKYGQVAKAVDRAFYNTALAEKIKLRVELD